jgi:hypothetical protein
MVTLVTVLPLDQVTNTDTTTLFLEVVQETQKMVKVESGIEPVAEEEMVPIYRLSLDNPQGQHTRVAVEADLVGGLLTGAVNQFLEEQVEPEGEERLRVPGQLVAAM